MRNFRQSLYRLVAVIGLLSVAAASGAPATRAQEGEMPAGDAEMAAMMEAMQRSMTPGPQHEMLARGTGTWKMTSRFWTDPEGEPMVSVGKAEASMELGGRVLVEKVSAEMMGMPFEGIGRTGYDNVTGKWWTTWTDNMSTGLMTMTGTYDEATRTHTFEGDMADPMTGALEPVKMTVRHESEDREVMEMFEPAPGGSMVRTMEIVYERQD